MAKNPMPTVTNPQPATSLYRKTPIPIRMTPMMIIIKVAQPKTVFLFIPIFKSLDIVWFIIEKHNSEYFTNIFYPFLANFNKIKFFLKMHQFKT